MSVIIDSSPRKDRRQRSLFTRSRMRHSEEMARGLEGPPAIIMAMSFSINKVFDQMLTIFSRT